MPGVKIIRIGGSDNRDSGSRAKLTGYVSAALARAKLLRLKWKLRK